MKKQKIPESKIKSIAIENFRAFKNRQEFPVRPINLIFGPNSAGKSALIKGLMYSLESGYPKQLDINGINHFAINDELTSGSPHFEYELVFNSFFGNVTPMHAGVIPKYLSEDLKSQFFKYSKETSFIFKHYVDKNKMHSSERQGSIIQFGKYRLSNCYLKESIDVPFWKRFNTQIKNANLLKLTLQKYQARMISKKIITNVEASIPKYYGLDPNNFIKQIRIAIEFVINRHGHWMFENENDYFNADFLLHEVDGLLFKYFWELCRDEIGSELIFNYGEGYFEDNEDELMEIHYKVESCIHMGIDFGFDEISGWNGKGLVSDRAILLLNSENLSKDDFITYSAMLIITAAYDIKKIYKKFFEFKPNNISKLLYLGVERESVDFSWNNSEFEKSPLNQYLRSSDCIEFCNSWFVKTDIPFELIKHEQLIGKDSGRPFLGSYNLPINIRDKRVNTVFPLKDVGYGLKKLIPVLAAVSYKLQHSDYNLIDYDLVAIEEPEIHLHPKLQSELGDLFMDNVVDGSRKTYFIETHSENMLQRILRRVREGKISHDAINVLYVHPGTSEEGAKVERLEINEEGEFKTPWPKGFFDSREDDILA